MTTGWINRCRSSAAGFFRRMGGERSVSPGPWPWMRRSDSEPGSIDQFTNEPVLVLAPHPDDEVIGPGGTIRRHVLAGAAVQPVILTDGKWGGFNGDGKLVERRKAESRRAAEILGSREPTFLDEPDGSLEDSGRVVDKLLEIFRGVKPRYVYLPALTDEHHDHWATNCILNSLLARVAEGERPVVRGYEVWTPLPANRVVDITEIAELKREAIGAFESQISTYDYAGAVLGLNHYRALRKLRGKGFAEGIMEMTAGEFAHYVAFVRK
jgi:LmbE family N-acetylglucosaminyl deacetylase